MILPLIGECDTGPRPEGPIGHVAVLGAAAGNKWAAALDDICASLVSSGESLQYQALGVKIANKGTPALNGYRVFWAARESFIPIAWTVTDRLWRSGPHRALLSPYTHGVHWFGGDWTSISLEDEIDADWMAASNCLVAQAWKMGMGLQ